MLPHQFRDSAPYQLGSSYGTRTTPLFPRQHNSPKRKGGNESVPRQVDRESRGPQRERGLEFSFTQKNNFSRHRILIWCCYFFQDFDYFTPFSSCLYAFKGDVWYNSYPSASMSKIKSLWLISRFSLCLWFSVVKYDVLFNLRSFYWHTSKFTESVPIMFSLLMNPPKTIFILSACF